MSEGPRPEEAIEALHEIRHRREQVVAVATVPAWYWRTIAVLMVGFAFLVDTHRPWVGIGTAVFVIAVLAATGRVVIAGVLRAQLRNDLMGPLGVLAILAFVAAVLAVSLPTAFALQAAGVRYAATLGVLAGAVLMAVGGPMLTRYLHRVMLRDRRGG
jgi:hypothetical protein